MADVTFLNPIALVALPLAWLLMLFFAWHRRFKPFGPFLLRLIILVLVSLALAHPVRLPPEISPDNKPVERLVLLVDQSASLGLTGQQALQAEATRLALTSPDVVTLFFADQPLLVLPYSPALINEPSDPDAPPLSVTTDVNTLPLDLEISNLADALTMGAEMLKDKRGRLILLTDGLPTKGDTLAALDKVAQKNIPVDVLLPDEALLQAWTGGSNDVRLTNLNLAPVLRQGETAALEVVVHSDEPTQTTLRLTHTSRDTVLAEDVLPLDPGFNRFAFDIPADELGLQTFQATLAADNDRQPANNSYSAVTQVFPPPRILVVGDDEAEQARFAQYLEEAGFVVDQMRSVNLPDRLSPLELYSGMVLLNVSARTLKFEQMLAIQEFVRSLGRGLLVTGGRDSYSLGHYEDTPLADLLPLSLEAPPREERPPVALLLIIDHSGSMLEQRQPATKLAMAKTAAIRATDILGPDDLIGIAIFDNRFEWVVPFQPVSDGAALLEIQQAVATIPGGGGTRILQALEMSLPELIAQESARGGSHAVLLSDGKSFDGQDGIEDYNIIVDAALEAGITLSTIAIGNESDRELLAYLAERGTGRYHFAGIPDELPALTVAESAILRSNAIQEGEDEEYTPTLFAPHPMVRGLFTVTPDSPEPQSPLPTLTGYIAMTPKNRAEIALQAGPGDPLLGVWGYGLGRVAAWSSDTGNEWLNPWASPADAARFWGQATGYTLPAPDLGLLQLGIALDPNDIITLTADGVSATGEPVDLAPTQATLISPGQQENSLTLRQVGPGLYQQRLRLPDTGPYQLTVNQDRGPDETEIATTGFVLPYPTEYNLPDEEAGEALLKQIATATGGNTFSVGDPLPQITCDPQLDSCEATSDQSQTPPSDAPVELWPWLLQLALILWPLEIAWRRWGRVRIQ